MAHIERRIETADGTLELENLPPDLQKRIREQEKQRKGGITLAEAKRRTEQLMREMRDLA